MFSDGRRASARIDTVDDQGVTRDELRSLMEGFAGEAGVAFRSLLDDPPADLHEEGRLAPTPTSSLLTIYRRRAEHARAIGLQAIGLEEAVRRFDATRYDALGLVALHGRSLWAVAFLAPDATEVVAAIVVGQEAPVDTLMDEG